MYFSKLNKTYYDPLKKGQAELAVNIINSVVAQYKPAYNLLLFYTHNVKEGQRPEEVATEIYGNVKYTWLVILLNQVVDPWFDWPLSISELHDYCESKYEDKNDIHHFIDLTIDEEVDDYDHQYFMNLYPNLPQNISPITNYQYEFEENLKRKEIKIINEEYLPMIVDQLDKALTGKI